MTRGRVEYGWRSGDLAGPQFFGWRTAKAAHMWMDAAGDGFRTKYAPWVLVRRYGRVVTEASEWKVIEP